MHEPNCSSDEMYKLNYISNIVLLSESRVKSYLHNMQITGNNSA